MAHSRSFFMIHCSWHMVHACASCLSILWGSQPYSACNSFNFDGFVDLATSSPGLQCAHAAACHMFMSSLTGGAKSHETESYPEFYSESYSKSSCSWVIAHSRSFVMIRCSWFMVVLLVYPSCGVHKAMHDVGAAKQPLRTAASVCQRRSSHCFMYVLFCDQDRCVLQLYPQLHGGQVRPMDVGPLPLCSRGKVALGLRSY